MSKNDIHEYDDIECPSCHKIEEAIPIDDYDSNYDFYCSYCGHHYNKKQEVNKDE